MIAYKFVDGEVKPLENFKNCGIYQIKEKLLNGKELDKSEQQSLLDMIHGQRYKTSYRLQGWHYDFYDYLNEYWIETEHSGLQKVFAFNKVQARKLCLYCGKIKKIIEVKK